MTDVQIRNYKSSDAENLNRVAVAAYGQFRDQFQNWPAMLAWLSNASALSATGEVIVVEVQDSFAGAVTYFGPDSPKEAFFDKGCSIIRMLVVDPPFRGQGLGRALSTECIARARRDGAPVIALHTSPIMTVALPMYLRMGFARAHDVPPIFGVPYAVYTKAL
jgi:GNAT superfamily N-acetyltransferase